MNLLPVQREDLANSQPRVEHQNGDIAQVPVGRPQVQLLCIMAEHELAAVLAGQRANPGYSVDHLPLLRETEHTAKRGQFPVDGRRTYRPLSAFRLLRRALLLIGLD